MNVADKHRFLEIVDAVVSENGGRVGINEVASAIANGHTDVFRTIAWPGFVNQVRSALNRSERVNGVDLPRMVSVDDAGTYVQRSLLDVDEYRVAIARYMTTARASRRKAYALASECRETHGVWIDPSAEAVA